MKQLNIYEIGVDPLPLEGSEIIYFDSNNCYGMFEQHYEKSGACAYMYGDLGDFNNLGAALGAGYQVDIDTEGFNENYEPEKITIEVDGTQIFRGCKWVYVHEYLPALDDTMFPFQGWEYYNLALVKGWVLEVKVLRELRTSFNERGKDVEVAYRDVLTRFSGKDFVVEWSSYGDKDYHLSRFSSCPTVSH
jgi:hypothetical protein